MDISSSTPADSALPELSPAKRALLAERLKGLHRQAGITRRAVDGHAAASFAQERLWFLERLGQGGSAYHTGMPLRITGVLDVLALERALGDIVRRHDALRTAFREHDGTLTQVISPHAAANLRIEDLSGQDRGAQEAAVKQMIAAHMDAPFDLHAGPLHRTLLVRLGRQEHVLAPCVHHLVIDGWSWGVLFRELWTSYATFREGRGSPLPDLAVQYADYALWQREQADGDHWSRSAAYWKQQLSGAPDLIALPADHPRPDVQRNRGAVEPIRLSPALRDRLVKLARDGEATLFMAVLAAFVILLRRYTGSGDVVVGTTVAGRARPEIQESIGLYMNPLVLRTDLSGDPGFREVLRRVREVVLGAYDHQHLPFERLVAELQPKRSLSHAPLFQVLFELDTREDSSGGAPGLTIEWMATRHETTKLDLELRLTTTSAGLMGGLRYSTDLFERATIQRMVAHLERVLARIADDPDCRTSQFPLLDAEERRQVLERWNDTAAPFPEDRCVHELFDAQAARTPRAVAMIGAGETLTFAALNARANQLAHVLRARGVGPDMRVGICLERGAELLVAILGVLKAGGAYVPLDPGAPAERQTYMLTDASVVLLLTQRRLRARAGAPPGVDVIEVDEEWPRIAAAPTSAPATDVTADHLCYVIYTSGSTGRPKGVAMHHRGVVNYIDWGVREYDAGSGHGAPVFTSTAVDLTVTSLLPLFAGGAVHLLPEEHPMEALVTVLRGKPGFGLMKLTPLHLSLLAQRLTADEARGAARTLVIGGDVLNAETTRFWREHAPAVRLINEYGPTETVVGCSLYHVPAAGPWHGVLPVGTPIQNLRFYVLDASLEPVPIGIPGELFIGGAGVARGYLGRPSLTADCFLPDPYATSGARTYRTGDRACWRADGTLVIQGRSDRQVKVRGYRVELGEVEAVLRRHHAVRDCHVMLREDRPGDRRLAAYVVGEATAEELRVHAARTQPDYMVPSAFVTMEELPWTPSGKLDRKALPIPEYGAAAGVIDLPRDFVEARLIQIWEELLGVTLVGPTQDFFDLGGNSLLILHLLTRIEQRLQCNLPLAAIVAGPTVREMAAAIRELRAGPDAPPEPVVPLQTHGTLPPLFCVHPAGRGVNNYVHLVRHLGSDQPVSGVVDLGDDLARPIPRIAAEHVRAIRALQAEGPYYLLGWSFGAIIVYEMALQLEREHQQVAFLGLMDGMEPELWRGLPQPDGALRVATLATEVAERMSRPFSLRREDLQGLSLDEQCLRAAEALHAQVGAPVDLSAAHLRESCRVVQARDETKRRYTAGELQGRMTLFLPDEIPIEHQRYFAAFGESERGTLGWRRLVRGGIEIHHIPGTHMAMGCEPHVRVLAGRVRESLAAARHRVAGRDV